MQNVKTIVVISTDIIATQNGTVQKGRLGLITTSARKDGKMWYAVVWENPWPQNRAFITNVGGHSFDFNCQTEHVDGDKRIQVVGA